MPGGNVPVRWLWAPSIKFVPPLFFNTATLGQDLTSPAGYGWGMLQGLNNRNLFLEFRGNETQDNANLPGMSPSQLRMQLTFEADFTMEPFIEDTTYTEYDAASRTVVASGLGMNQPVATVVTATNV